MKTKHKWGNAPTIEDLNQAVTAGTPDFISHVVDVEKWLKSLHTTGILLPSNPDGTPLNRSTIEPKLIRKHAEWRYSALTEPFHTADTLFELKPASFEDQPLVDQDQAVLAHQFRHNIDSLKLIDDAARTGVDEGTIVLQTGWFHKEREVTVPTMSQDTLGNVVEGTIEITEVLESHPTVTILGYDQVILDPNARGNIKEAQYVIVRRTDTIARMEEEGTFSNLDKLQHSSATLSNSFNTRSTVDSFSDSTRNEIEVLEYWGFWDIHKTGELVPIVIQFSGDVIIKEQINPFPDDALPFVVIPYLPVRDSNYGEPDGVLLEDNQRVTGAITRGMIDLLGKSAIGQRGFASNALDSINKLRFQRGEDYTFRDDIDPSKLLYQHTYPEIPNSALTMLTLQQQEAESLTGVNTMGQGVSSASLGTGSATAARGALSSAAKREAGILRRLAHGFEQVARKIILMNHHFLDEEAVTRITNKEYVAPDLGRNTLIDVIVGVRTAEEDNAAANDLETVIQTVGNSIDPKLTQVILGKIMKLKGLPDLAHQVETYEPEPDPVQQEIQQLELELLKAKLENEMAMSNERNTQAQYNSARANTEGEKTRKLGAEADKTNLDFVEQETGTEHERARDLLKVQAEGNMHLKSLETDIKKLDSKQ